MYILLYHYVYFNYVIHFRDNVWETSKFLMLTQNICCRALTFAKITTAGLPNKKTLLTTH